MPRSTSSKPHKAIKSHKSNKIRIVIREKPIHDKIEACKRKIVKCYQPLNNLYKEIKQLTEAAQSFPIDSNEYKLIEKKLISAKQSLPKIAKKCANDADQKGYLKELKELAYLSNKELKSH